MFVCSLEKQMIYDFEVGDKVICVDATDTKWLTTNTRYIVHEIIDSDFISVKNNGYYVDTYYKNRFKPTYEEYCKLIGIE